jgi:hypothetical protein
MPKQNTPDLLAGGVSKHYLVGVAVVMAVVVIVLFGGLVHDGGFGRASDTTMRYPPNAVLEPLLSPVSVA